MKLTFLGGASEVGKSSVLAEVEDTNIIFDSGLKLTEPPTGPEPTSRVDVAFLSHAHLDHCGNLPSLHRQHRMPVYATPVSFELSHMLQKDSIKIDKIKGYDLKYTEQDMARMTAGEIHVSPGRQYRFHNKFDFRFYDAGHIPGSAGILVDGGGKSVFYTGDTNAHDTRLLDKAQYPEHADVVISESTYGNRSHPERRDVEAEFLKQVDETINGGGVALVPVFAIGRTQEILLLLRDTDYTIYLDGMAKSATQTILKYPDTVKDNEKLEEAAKSTIWVKGKRQRKKICEDSAVIVTTAGMLAGGPVLDYLNHLHRDASSSILLTGYQVEDTNGRLLVEKGYVIDEETQKRFDVNMTVKQYDFSAHSGKEEIVKTITDMNPEHVVLMHGDEDAIESLKHEFGQKRVYTPKIGDTIEI